MPVMAIVLGALLSRVPVDSKPVAVLKTVTTVGLRAAAVTTWVAALTVAPITIAVPYHTHCSLTFVGPKAGPWPPF